MSEQRVRVESGKYIFVRSTKMLEIEILRGGEPWHTQHDATKALGTMMAELDAARVVLAAAREIVEKTPRGDTRAMVASIDKLADAVAKHDRLVDDREPPSAWCEP